VKRVLLAVLLLLTACSAPQAAPAPAPAPVAGAIPAPALGTGSAAAPVLRWTPCHGSFQCAGAIVPLSYREPKGATLTLSVIRLPAGDPGHRLGSLFFNFGGPGTDGVGELTRFAARYPPELRARFDLVSFDPRGSAAPRRSAVPARTACRRPGPRCGSRTRSSPRARRPAGRAPPPGPC
jgi:hypothetical protein